MKKTFSSLILSICKTLEIEDKEAINFIDIYNSHIVNKLVDLSGISEDQLQMILKKYKKEEIIKELIQSVKNKQEFFDFVNTLQEQFIETILQEAEDDKKEKILEVLLTQEK